MPRTAKQWCAVIGDALMEEDFHVTSEALRDHCILEVEANLSKGHATLVIDDDGLIEVLDTHSDAGEVIRALERRGFGRDLRDVEIELPKMPRWEQIGGDMNPGSHGGTIARSDGRRIELLKIQPVREYVGDSEAAEVGFPFWTREAYFDLDDLDLNSDVVQSALNYIGMSPSKLVADVMPQHRALVIAEALLDYGKADEGPAGFSGDILSENVKWMDGTIAGPEYLADEDEAFRAEVLQEEDEEDAD